MNLKPSVVRPYTFIPRDFIKRLIHFSNDDHQTVFLLHSFLQCDLSCRPIISCMTVETYISELALRKQHFLRLLKSIESQEVIFKYLTLSDDKRKKTVVTVFKFVDNDYHDDKNNFNYVREFLMIADVLGVNLIQRYKLLYHFREFVIKYFNLDSDCDLNCYSKIPTNILSDLFRCPTLKDEEYYKYILRQYQISLSNIFEVFGTEYSSRRVEGGVIP